MINTTEAIRLAQKFLEAGHFAEVPLIVDEAGVVIRDGYLFAPCNSEEFIRTGNLRAMVIGCTPVEVDLNTGACRFLSLDETMELDL
ncbi:hypothetical protein [Streptomyces kanamyceticus]|uniref:hypothetical protein n=1 Tax=Streptomyces kanamyceticus TaxID=1967 RepID=UPI0037DBF47B